jgi:tetratricopeptide (TPR) repeat protein
VESAGEACAPRALALADEAVALDPSSISAHQARADALAAMGRKEEARQEWDTALSEARMLEPGAHPCSSRILTAGSTSRDFPARIFRDSQVRMPADGNSSVKTEE